MKTVLKASGAPAPGATLGSVASVRFVAQNIIPGTSRDDTLTGTAGDDVIDGGRGDDVLYGLDGDDILKGDPGRDELFGGAGDDLLDGGGFDDLIDGGEGSDTVDYSATTADVHVFLGGYWGGQRATFPGTKWEDETLVSIENAITGSGNDVFHGTGDDNRFEGGAGNDTFHGGTGRDTFVGGAGIDTIHISALSEAEDTDWYYYAASFKGYLGVIADLSKSSENLSIVGLNRSYEPDVDVPLVMTASGIENIYTEFWLRHVDRQ